MIKNLVAVLLVIGFKVSFTQPIVLGTVNRNQVVLNEKNTKALNIAYLRTFNDGRKLDSFYVDYLNGKKYFILIGSRSSIKSKSAITMVLENGNLVLNDNLEIKSCTNNSCSDCSFFFENNKINACNCPSEETISNHCTYKVGDGSFFFKLLKRILEN